jgi:hypothetical protein
MRNALEKALCLAALYSPRYTYNDTKYSFLLLKLFY